MSFGRPESRQAHWEEFPSRRRAAWLLGPCAFALSLSIAAPAGADTDESVEAFLRSADEAFRVASRRYRLSTTGAIDQTRQVVSSFFDVPAMAREAVGTAWTDARQNERDELVGALTDRLARQVARERSKTDRVTLVFVDRRALDDGSLLVSARLSAEGRERSVSWRLVRHNSGYHIVDIVTEAGGIVADLRSRFMRFTGQPDGIREFSKSLRARS